MADGYRCYCGGDETSYGEGAGSGRWVGGFSIGLFVLGPLFALK